MASNSILLTVYGDRIVDGYQDEDGVEHFNDRVGTPLGDLGKLAAEQIDGELTITQADEVVLIWKHVEGKPGVTVETTAFGFRLFDLEASNGMVRYRIFEEPVEWADSDEGPIEHWLAIRTFADWKPVVPPHPEYRHETKTKDLKLVTEEQMKKGRTIL